jgi:hypothetical protein
VVIAMGDIGVINLEDATMVEKNGHSCPRGSKNKPKASAVDAFSSTSAKHRPGHPLGSKNKVKTSTLPTSASKHLDVSLTQPVLPQSSARNLLSFFDFAGAQCDEQELLPLKFTEFMEGQDLCEAILREVSNDGPPYEVEVYYDGQGDMFFKGGWPRFAKDQDLHQGWFLMFNYHCGTAKFDVKIFDGTQCQKKYASTA